MRAPDLRLVTAFLLASCAARTPAGESGAPPAATAPEARAPETGTGAAEDAAARRRAYGPVFVPELLNEGLLRNGAFELLSELCTRAPHRLAGSEGAARAVEWGREAMLRVGLENVRLEPVLVPHWERGELEELTVVEPASHAGMRLPVLALGGSIATPEGGLAAEVLAVGSFEELEQRAAEARGKIVLFRRPMDPTAFDPFEAYGGAVNQRGGGADQAARAGAVAALVRSMTLLQDDEPHTGAMRYGGEVARVPAAAISTNGADLVSAWLEAGQRVTLRLALGCREFEDAPSFNVVGELPGSSGDEVVLIGGHLDAWDVGQGAHDDGAGIAHVLEAARLLAHSKLGRPRRTVRCVLFMNEENGLRGGLAYRDANKTELARHVLALESDRGGALPLGYATDATGAAAELLRELYGGAPIARGGGADISVLAEFGVPLAGLYPNPQRYFDFHHSRHDTLEAVSPRELQLGAISLASMAYLAANHQGPWPRAAATERSE